MDERDYPGYSNIAFQRAKHFVFSFFRLDLASMSRFAAMMDDFLLAEAERRRNKEDVQAEAAGQSVAELTGSFVDILLSSMTVAFYGRFESFLVDVCQMVHDNGVYPTGPGFLKNIEAAKNYLEKVPNLLFPKGTKAWIDIGRLNDLRDVIAHRNRIIGEGDTQLRRGIEDIPHVSINQRREVWLERGLLEHMAETLDAFTASLEQAFGPTGRVPGGEAPNLGPEADT